MVASLYCVPFSLVLFLVACIPMEEVLHLEKKSFSGIKVSMQLSFSTDIYAEVTFVNLLVS